MERTWQDFLKTDQASPDDLHRQEDIVAAIPHVRTHRGSISAAELAERIVADTPQLHGPVVEAERDMDAAARPLKSRW